VQDFNSCVQCVYTCTADTAMAQLRWSSIACPLARASMLAHSKACCHFALPLPPLLQPPLLPPPLLQPPLLQPPLLPPPLLQPPLLPPPLPLSCSFALPSCVRGTHHLSAIATDARRVVHLRLCDLRVSKASSGRLSPSSSPPPPSPSLPRQ
jgi:hypothetical protein